MSARRYSEESTASHVAARPDNDGVKLASASPNNITNVVAGVAPANFTAVLNPLRPSAGARTASSRGKPATPISNSALPAVTRSDFDEYLKEIGPQWKKAQQRASTSSGRPGAQSANGLPLDKTLAASTNILLPSLDVVPDIFRDEQFMLANPHTFDLVTRPEAINGDGASMSSMGDLAADQILQEKLSHYLDTVELHLTREISLRSASFFSALANLQSLHTQSAQALDRVAALRTALQAVDQATAQTGLAAVRAGVKRRRLESMASAIDRLRELAKAVEQATQLANAGEWEGVLGIVEEVEGAIAPPVAAERDALGISVRPQPDSNAAPALQLHRLTALKGMPARLARLRAQVASSLEKDAVTALLNEFEDAVLAYKQTDESPSVWQEKLKAQARSRATDRLRPMVRGLLRCGWSALENVVPAWKAALAKEIKQYVRADLPDGAGDVEEALNGTDSSAATPSKSASINKALSDMSHADFVSLCRRTMSRLIACVDVASLHGAVLADLIAEAAGPDTADARSALTMELTDVVHASAELANLRFSKIIAARSTVHAELELRDFVELFNEAWAFVVQCETACQRMIVGLRGVLVGQAKAFLQAFHQARVSDSAKQVEVEQWVPMDVPAAIQTMVDDIISGAVKDPKTFLLRESHGDQAQANGSSTVSKHLLIEDRKYFAVAAGAKALQSLADYIRIVLNLPLLATDSMSRIIEFLKQFNSRTCQVVLGAGAMRSAGLKNITAKNLALASQALSVMIALVPYIREALRRHLSTKQATMLTEFDKLKRDYQEHQYEIHAKFVAIMGDRLAVHCKTLQTIDWRKEDEPSPQKYMEQLVKETSTLHKVLVRFLQTSTVDQITGQVLKDIYARLSEEYGKIELHDAAAKAKLLGDAQYLRTEVAGFKGLTISLPGTLLEDLVQAKPTTIAPPRPPTPPREPTPQPEPELVSTPPVTSETKAFEPTSPTIQVEPPAAPSSADIARSASSAAMRNRLAGLFGKRSGTLMSPSATPVMPTPPVLPEAPKDPPRTSTDSPSSIEKEREQKRNSALAERLAALAGGSQREAKGSTESLPGAARVESPAVEEGPVMAENEAQVQAAEQLAEHLAPDEPVASAEQSVMEPVVSHTDDAASAVEATEAEPPVVKLPEPMAETPHQEPDIGEEQSAVEQAAIESKTHTAAAAPAPVAEGEATPAETVEAVVEPQHTAKEDAIPEAAEASTSVVVQAEPVIATATPEKDAPAVDKAIADEAEP